MTARLFLVSPSQWGTATLGDQVVVEGVEARHAVQVVRVGVGEEVLLSDGAGRRATAEVVDAVAGREGARLVVRLGPVQDEPLRSPRLVLVQALAKGDRDEQAVEAATELGVDVVVPWQAERSIVQWRGDKEARGRARWEAVVLAAAKQSRRARVPSVEDVVRLAGARALVERSSLALVLHEDAEQPLAGVELPDDGEVTVLVGPEGGNSPAELETLTAAGAHAVRLGPEVLRSSSAGPAALAVLNALGRWR